jgi:hypothetical protein
VGTTNIRINVISLARSDIGMKSSHGLTLNKRGQTILHLKSKKYPGKKTNPFPAMIDYPIVIYSFRKTLKKPVKIPDL